MCAFCSGPAEKLILIDEQNKNRKGKNSMPMNSGRPTPPAWRILLYSLLSLLLLLALGWFNTHVLGDHMQYPPTGTERAESSLSSSAGETLPAQ